MVKIEIPIEKFLVFFTENYQQSGNAEQAIQETLYDLGQDYLLVVNQVILEGFPLGSMQASGKFRDKIFCTLKGKTYIKRYKKPRDPRTGKQLTNRSLFSQAAAGWQTLTETEKEAYNQAAKYEPYSGYNLWFKEFFEENK